MRVGRSVFLGMTQTDRRKFADAGRASIREGYRAYGTDCQSCGRGEDLTRVRSTVENFASIVIDRLQRIVMSASHVH